MKIGTRLKCLAVFLLSLDLTLTNLSAATVSTPPSYKVSSTPPAQSWGMILSPGGEFGIFHSIGGLDVTLQADDAICHLFYRQLSGGLNGLLTRSATFKPANGSSIALGLSGNSRYLLVLSDATNLTTNNVKGGNNLLRLDLQTKEWLLINHDENLSSASGRIETAQISSDGRWVLFSGNNRSLTTSIPTTGGNNLYLADLETGQITLENSFGGGQDDVVDFALSPDGKNAIYSTAATAALNSSQLIVRDLATHTSLRPVLGSVEKSNPFALTISPDGQFFFFSQPRTASLPLTITRGEFGRTNMTQASDLIPKTAMVGVPMLCTTNGSRLFLANTNGILYWDPDTSNGLIPLSTLATNGGSAISRPYSINDDGTKLLYGSNVDPAGTIQSVAQLFLTDLTTGQTVQITHPTNQETDVGSFANAVMDRSARRVIFDTLQTDYAKDDFNGRQDIFSYDVATAKFTLITAKIEGGVDPKSPGFSTLPARSVSDEGTYAIFFSSAPSLLAPFNLTNSALFGQNLATGQRELLSVDVTGLPLNQPPIQDAVLSADGKFVLMLTTATNMTARYANQKSQLVLRDIAKKTNHLAGSDAFYLSSVSSGFSIVRYAISADGRRVAYTTSRNSTVLLYDRLTDNADEAVRRIQEPTIGVPIASWALSPDGHSLAFVSGGPDLSTGAPTDGSPQMFVRDLDSKTNRWLPSAFDGLTPAEIASSGANLTFSDDSKLLTLSRLQGQKATFIDVPTGLKIGSVGNAPDAVISRDRQYVAYRRPVSMGTPTGTPTTQIYLTHLPSGETRLVSHTSDQPNTPAVGYCSVPAFSSNSVWLTFSSTAYSLTGAASNTFPQVYLYNILTDKLSLVTATSSTGVGLNQASGSVRLASGSSTLLLTSAATDYKSAGQPSGLIDIYQTQLPIGPTPKRDSDNDGIPDWWENRYIGDLTKQAWEISPDGVSIQQAYEQSAGLLTNLWIGSSYDSSTGELQITFPSVVGKAYGLESTSDLSNPVWPTSTFPVTATGETTTFSQPPQTDPAFTGAIYFRVVQLP